MIERKECSKCNKTKSTKEFNKSGLNKDGSQRYRNECKNCYKYNWKYRLISNLSSKEANRFRPDGSVIKKKIRDKRINLLFLEEMKEKQNGLCYWLNIPIDFTYKDKLRNPSVDRLDNSKGYEIDNIVLSCKEV